MKKTFLIAALGCALNAFTTDASGREVTVYLTAQDTNQRLTKTGGLKFEPKAQPGEREITVFVDPSKKFQTFLGIGAALTDAAAETFYKLPKAQQQKFLKAYFDPGEGIGYTLARTHIHSCDFSSESYTYVQADDRDLKSFDIAHDLKQRIPFIKEVRAAVGREFKLYVSPWSPPAWMKTSTNMLQGGKLKPEFAASWANYFAKFIKAYEQAGVPI